MKTLILFAVLLFSFVPQSLEKQNNIDGYYENDRFIVIRIDPTVSHIAMCYKNSDGEVIGDFGRLKKEYGNQIIFACNAGMFMTDLRPLGLYIEDGKVITPLNTRNASTNFYIKPNGVFYILYNGTVGICKTESWSQIYPKFATQSGPMLTINGQINSKFNIASESYRTRNGVGIDTNGKVLFILATIPVNFYEFASLFLLFDCQNSLFLDGDISDFYCPEKGLNNKYGYMSPMIIVTK